MHSSVPRLDPADGQSASHAERPGAGPGRAAEDGLSGWARRRMRLLEMALFGTASDRVLSYREVVDYLAANRPAGPGLVRGALLRRQRTGIYEFRMLYLDEADEPLTDRPGGTVGFAVLARDCDEELRELFGYNDIIVFG
jgi:hypothetical protein